MSFVYYNFIGDNEEKGIIQKKSSNSNKKKSFYLGCAKYMQRIND